jgi:hypothetical protein
MPHAVSFMPYFPDAQINEVLGDFRVWNWERNADKFATEPHIREYLNRYFGLYKTVRGRPEDRIAVVSPAAGDQFPANQDLGKLGRFNNTVMACYLFNLPIDHDALPFCLSDNFTGLYLPSIDGDANSSIAFEFGSYFRVRQAGSWDYLTFATPQFVPEMGQCKPVARLLPLMLKLLGDKSRSATRFFRSLEWLRLAFVNYENIPYDVRLVAMCSAFEALLDLPEYKKENHFSRRVHDLLPAHNLPTTSRTRKSKVVADTPVGWWCRDFYQLRSRLVHGEETSPRDWQHSPGIEHLTIAVHIFEECVWGLLQKQGLISSDDRRMEFAFRSRWRDFLGVAISAFT